jgi:hypothetical protein
LKNTPKYFIFKDDYQSVMMINVSKVTHKSSDLTSVMVEHFEKRLNITGVNFISLFIGTLFKVQPVCIKKFFSGLENNYSSDYF